jgi:hypothetical protein
MQLKILFLINWPATHNFFIKKTEGLDFANGTVGKGAFQVSKHVKENSMWLYRDRGRTIIF